MAKLFVVCILSAGRGKWGLREMRRSLVFVSKSGGLELVDETLAAQRCVLAVGYPKHPTKMK
jgi:hypothetical protein